MGELVPITNRDAFVAMAMTDAAFDSARRYGAVGIDADLEAMTVIAHDIGFIKEPVVGTLPPLVLVAREAGKVRSVVGDWDHRLPATTADPQTGRYFSVTELGSDRPNTAPREQLVGIARAMGATAFYEISIHDWNGPHVEAFAKALLTGKRPLDLPPPRHPIVRVGKFFADPLTGDGQKMHRIYSARDHQPPFADPFTIRRAGSDLAPA